MAGDEITVEPLPFIPSYLQSIDIEAAFLKRGLEIAEAFSADEMAHNFIRAYNGVIFTAGQLLIFEFHGHALRLVIKGVQIVDPLDPKGRSQGQSVSTSGVLMDKTEITFMKAGDSPIKIKSSAKKYACILKLQYRV